MVIFHSFLYVYQRVVIPQMPVVSHVSNVSKKSPEIIRDQQRGHRSTHPCWCWKSHTAPLIMVCSQEKRAELMRYGFGPWLKKKWYTTAIFLAIKKRNGGYKKSWTTGVLGYLSFFHQSAWNEQQIIDWWIQMPRNMIFNGDDYPPTY